MRVGSTAPRSARVGDVFSSGVDGGGGGGGGIFRGAQGCGVECSRLADKELFNAGIVSFLLPKNVNKAWNPEASVLDGHLEVKNYFILRTSLTSYGDQGRRALM